MNQHRKLQEWVEEMAWLCEPEHIVWIDGSEEEKDALVNQAVSTGEVSLLNQEKLPGASTIKRPSTTSPERKTSPTFARRFGRTLDPPITGCRRKRDISGRARSSRAP